MSVLAIVLIVLAAIVLLLFATGVAGAARRRRAQAADLQARVAAANEALAAAHAADRGWEPATVESAAREAFSAAHPGAPIDALHLVQVIDRPGTDEDEAVFRVMSGDAEHDVHLGRRDGAWVAR